MALVGRFFVPIEIAEDGVPPFGRKAILNREKPGEDVIVRKRRDDFEAEVERVSQGKIDSKMESSRK